MLAGGSVVVKRLPETGIAASGTQLSFALVRTPEATAAHAASLKLMVTVLDPAVASVMATMTTSDPLR